MQQSKSYLKVSFCSSVWAFTLLSDDSRLISSNFHLLTATLPSLQAPWPQGTECVARYNFKGTSEQDLPFKKGDVLTIIVVTKVSRLQTRVPLEMFGWFWFRWVFIFWHVKNLNLAAFRSCEADWRRRWSAVSAKKKKPKHVWWRFAFRIQTGTKLKMPRAAREPFRPTTFRKEKAWNLEASWA